MGLLEAYPSLSLDSPYDYDAPMVAREWDVAAVAVVAAAVATRGEARWSRTKGCGSQIDEMELALVDCLGGGDVDERRKNGR